VFSEKGVKFIVWLKSNKLEIRVYPVDKTQAKLYIMGFNQDNMDT
jgi:hypothetical protein